MLQHCVSEVLSRSPSLGMPQQPSSWPVIEVWAGHIQRSLAVFLFLEPRAFCVTQLTPSCLLLLQGGGGGESMQVLLLRQAQQAQEPPQEQPEQQQGLPPAQPQPASEPVTSTAGSAFPPTPGTMFTPTGSRASVPAGVPVIGGSAAGTAGVAEGAAGTAGTAGPHGEEGEGAGWEVQEATRAVAQAFDQALQVQQRF